MTSTRFLLLSKFILFARIRPSLQKAMISTVEGDLGPVFGMFMRHRGLNLFHRFEKTLQFAGLRRPKRRRRWRRFYFRKKPKALVRFSRPAIRKLAVRKAALPTFLKLKTSHILDFQPKQFYTSTLFVHRKVLGGLTRSWWLASKPYTTQPTLKPLVSKVRVQKLRTYFRFLKYLPASFVWFHFFALFSPAMAYDLSVKVQRFKHTSIVKAPTPQYDLTFYWTTLAALSYTPYDPNWIPFSGSLTGAFFCKYLINFLQTFHFSRPALYFVPYKIATTQFKQLLKSVKMCSYPRLKTFHKALFLTDFFELVTLAFYQKNAELFLRWLIKFMERINPKLHKRFLFFLKLFFDRFFATQPEILGFRGFKLTVKGKISVSGNAKKRTKRLRYGINSLSTKVYRISYARGVVHTHTGVLGLKFFLFY